MKFNGIFQITTQDKLIKQVKIKNGVVVSSQKSLTYDGDYSCTFDGITSCADDDINAMNWIEYGFCLAGAPLCLAELYASCIYENCGTSPAIGPGDLLQ